MQTVISGVGSVSVKPEESSSSLVSLARSLSSWMSPKAVMTILLMVSTALGERPSVPLSAVMTEVRRVIAEVTGRDSLGPEDARSVAPDSNDSAVRLALAAKEIAAANRTLAARVENDQVVAQQRIIDEQKALMDSLTAVSALVSTNSITATFGAVNEANNAVAKSIITPELNNTVSTSLTAPVLDLPNVDPASQVTTSFKELPATQPDFVLLPPMQASLYNASSLSLGNGVSSFGVSSFGAPALTFRPAPR